MYIRWMNAFAGRNLTAKKTLAFELNRSSEVAAEQLQQIGTALVSYINQPWGLLVDPKAVVLTFSGDCYSSYEGDRLVKGRNPRNAKSKHKEVFAQPVYTGIVLSQGYTPNKHEMKAMKATSLPMFRLTKGGLKPMV